MAISSPATGASTAYYLAAGNQLSYCVRNSPSISAYSGARKQSRRRSPVMRSSGDEGTTAIEADTETPAEVPKGRPSLISTLNVEKALRGIAITDVDHYGRLGLWSGCSYDQVNAAYKDKVTEVMNKGLDEEELNKELEVLKESHGILSTVEERRLYDWSLARTGNPDRYTWPSQADITQVQSPGTPPPQFLIITGPEFPFPGSRMKEPENEEPTRLLGYFFISWVVLSFALFIAFNR